MNYNLKEYYEDFHESFKGDIEESFRVCQTCGGKCEYSMIGSLLPGEKEYLATNLELNITEFCQRYLDEIIISKEIKIDVIRLGVVCPFLDTITNVCRIKQFKPILCAIYPLVFQIIDDKVLFYLDPKCPINQNSSLSNYYLKAEKSLQKIPISLEWYKSVDKYWRLSVDIDKIHQLQRGDKRQTWELDILKSISM